MKWINIKDEFPPLDEMVMVYKHKLMGGYYPGIYLATYVRHYRGMYMFIDDRETNTNNYRGLDEFSHWCPLPKEPNENKLPRDKDEVD